MKYRLVKRAAMEDFVVFAADITEDAIPDIILKIPPEHAENFIEIDVEWHGGEDDLEPGIIPDGL